MEKEVRDRFLESLLRHEPRCPYCSSLDLETEQDTIPQKVSSHLKATIVCLSCEREWVADYAIVNTELLPQGGS